MVMERLNSERMKLYKCAIALFITLSGVFLIATVFMSAPKNKEDIAQILGISNAEIESFDYYETGAIGEYYSVEKYELTLSTIQEFVSHSSRILNDGSVEDDIGTLCLKHNWQKGPIDLLALKGVYEMGFIGGFSEKAIKWVEEAKKTVHTANAYYAFYCKYLNRENLLQKKTCEMHTYVLDVSNGTLYIILVDL